MSRLGCTGSASIVTPSGRPGVSTVTSPPKSARVARTSVAKRLPLGTTTVCRSCVGVLPPTLGMLIVNFGSTGVTSTR